MVKIVENPVEMDGESNGKPGAFLEGHAMFQASIFKGGTKMAPKTLPHYAGVMKKNYLFYISRIKPNAINADVYGNVEGIPLTSN